MSSDTPDRPPGGGVIQALGVPRNVAVGLAVGAAVAAGAYLVRVLELFGPFVGTRRFPVVGPEGWFLLLAFVLATSTAFVVATLLTLISAYRLARELR